jgi:hypothetical protein
MNKLDLQQELLEKVKPGIKPSDLKKLKNSNGEKDFGLDNSQSFLSHQENNTPASSPPASPVIVPVDKKTKPDLSFEYELALLTKIQQLQEQVDF